MKISELIKSLEDKKEELGDIEVVIETNHPDSHETFLSYNIYICKDEGVTAYCNSCNSDKKVFDTALVLL